MNSAANRQFGALKAPRRSRSMRGPRVCCVSTSRLNPYMMGALRVVRLDVVSWLLLTRDTLARVELTAGVIEQTSFRNSLFSTPLPKRRTRIAAFCNFHGVGTGCDARSNNEH
jgi:hypothetical protein